MGKLPTPSITATLAAGSTSSPYLYDVNITQRLCFATCIATTPVFYPTISLVAVSPVSTGLYMATLHVEGVISYVPCNGGCCDVKAQPLSQNFNLLIASADAPTVTLSAGAPVNAMSAAGCQSCGRTFVSEIPLTVTVTA